MNQQILNDMQVAFDEIQQPRSPFVLQQMVIGSRYTPEQQYAQCVLELSIAYDNLRVANAKSEIKQIDIDSIDTSTRKGELEKQIAQVELEQLHRAMLGASREFEYLFNTWQGMRKYTRAELNAAQPEEYRQKLLLQAQQDLNATGRISQGNQEGLRQLGQVVYPQLDISRAVENRYLEGGKLRILVGVPTEHKADRGVPCLENVELPSGAEIKLFNSFGRTVAENYNNIVQEALNDKADYIVTIEDDTFPSRDAVVRLFELIKKHPKTAVGAWYPKKEESRQGVHIEIKNGIRQQMPDDGLIHEAYTLAMGCSIFPIEMFMVIPYPWFVTTPHLSQDSYFSQLAREHGFNLLVDTSIKCRHICRIMGKVYE